MGGAGGAAGVLLGGILTQYLVWRWILFINVPIAIAAAARQRPADRRGPQSRAARATSTCAGALAATLGLSLLVLGIVRTDVDRLGLGRRRSG